MIISNTNFNFLIIYLLLFLFVFSSKNWAQDSTRQIESLECRNLELSEVVRLFSVQTDLNIVPSAEAAKVKVSLNLKNISAEDAIDLLCKTHGLWYKKEDRNNAYRIHTIKEYRRDLMTLQEEQTQVFTLLYPNVFDVAQAIRDLYGSRVQLSFGNDGEESLEDLEDRFERFDLIEERSEGLGQSAGQGGSGSLNNRSSSSRLNRNRDSRLDSQLSRSRTRSSTSSNREAQASRTLRREVYENLTPEEIQAIERGLAGEGADSDLLESLILRRNAPIYLTVVRRQNRLAVRTGDEKALDQIRSLVKTFDIPTPTVLLEVKIMQVTLGDGFDSVFDFSFKKNSYSGGFTEGDFGLPPEGSFLPGGSGIRSDNLLFQYVSGSFAARLQLLENQNRVTTLATPLLLTANQEVSRIFVGDTLPIVTGFTEPETLATDNNVVIVPGSPITERSDVGTALLITPTINADRTVSLQILQETSEVNPNGARIPVSNADGSLTDQTIDTIRRRTLAGTVIAKDGLAIAIGGLIEESVSENSEQTPILGEIPLLGMLFRREGQTKLRQELVIVIRPYVLTTVPEAEKASEVLLEELSIHPTTTTKKGTLNTYRPEDVRKGNAPISDLHKLFNFHSGKTKEKD